MKFYRLAEYFERLEATTKRLEMYEILSGLFRETSSDNIDSIIYLSQGRLLPPFKDVEIGMSEKLLARAISEAANTPTRVIEESFRDTGDLGATAEKFMQWEGHNLGVVEVCEELKAIAQVSGSGSVDKKIGLLSNLFKGVSSKGAKYLSRFVIGRLRLGIGDPTVLESLALAFGGRELRPELEKAYNLCSDLGLVAKTLLEKGIDGVRKFNIHVGYPVRMALCERLPSAEDIISKMEEAAIEAKYDGLRCQVHKDGKKVEIFSRNLERTTNMFPDICEAARNFIKSNKAIFEGEALAYNEATGELFPFQITMQRKRKHGIDAMARDFPLKFFAFELLYSDGVDYTGKPFIERRGKLEGIINKNNVIEPSELLLTRDPKEIEKYFDEAVARGLEGVIAKRPDAPYAAGGRNFNWIKLKRSYRGELTDTIDLCIVGYFRGKGSRTKFGLGALLGAVYEPSSDTFKTVSKVGSGFTEEELGDMKRHLDEVTVTHKHPRVDALIEADAWVEPRYVITVNADEITRSPSHTAGQDKDGIGYALRFPRTVGFIRPDKSAEDATTVKEIIDMYDQQKKVKMTG